MSLRRLRSLVIGLMLAATLSSAASARQASAVAVSAFPCRWNYDLQVGLRAGYVTGGESADCTGRRGTLTLSTQLYRWIPAKRKWRLDRSVTRSWVRPNRKPIRHVPGALRPWQSARHIQLGLARRLRICHRTEPHPINVGRRSRPRLRLRASLIPTAYGFPVRSLYRVGPVFRPTSSPRPVSSRSSRAERLKEIPERHIVDAWSNGSAAAPRGSD